MNPTAPPWPEAAYRIDLPRPVPDDLSGLAGQLFRRVWRTTLVEPGSRSSGSDARRSRRTCGG